MLAKPIIIINPANLKTLIQDKTINEFYGVALDLNSFGAETEKDIQKLLFNSNIRFCFTVNFSSRNSEPSIEAIKKLYGKAMLYFFSENYIRLKNNPIINFLANPDNQVDIQYHMMFASNNKIFEQGFKGIECAFFNAEISSNFSGIEQPYYYCNLNVNLSKENEKMLSDSYFNGFLANKFIFINATEVKDIKQKYAPLKNIETSIKAKNEALYNALESIVHLKNEIDERDIHIQSLQQRVDNSDIFMELLRKDLISHSTALNNQYESSVREKKYLIDEKQTILEWYLKEYEVLPLWYKRFGHFIKVAKGKRSLKSLLKQDKK